MAEPSEGPSMAEPSEENPQTPEGSSITEPSEENPQTSEDPSMAESSEEKPQTPEVPSMAEPSEENPQPPNQNPVSFFRLQIHPASKLKQGIESLNDDDFNKQGIGMLETRINPFEITVRNCSTRVVGYLSLSYSSVIDTHISDRFTKNKKLINLNQISQILSGADDDDAIAIHNLEGSNKLCITFGKLEEISYESDEMFRMELIEYNGEFKMIDHISSFEYEWEALLQVGDMRHLIELVEQEDCKSSKLVTCEVTDTSGSFTVQEKMLNLNTLEIEWMENTVEFDYVAKTLYEIEPGQILSARFCFYHCDALDKALLLAEEVLLGITSNSEYVTLKFDLKGVEVIFIMEGTSVIPKHG